MGRRIWPLLTALFLLGSVALAQSGAYDLSWWTVDNGGGTWSSGGRFRLGGTIAQPDAGLLSGGRFDLLGGWWGGKAAAHLACVPLVTKGYVSAPDLVVEQFLATATDVTLVIRNQGNAAAYDEFWVDVYLSPNPPPTHVNQLWNDLGAEGLAWGVVAPALPIAPGEAVTLTVGNAYFWPGYSYVAWPIPGDTPVYAQVDSYNAATTYGAVLENHEITGAPYNNILGPVYSLPGASGEQPPVLGGNPPASGLPPRP
jgi:hypothetical protein